MGDRICLYVPHGTIRAVLLWSNESTHLCLMADGVGLRLAALVRVVRVIIEIRRISVSWQMTSAVVVVIGVLDPFERYIGVVPHTLYRELGNLVEPSKVENESVVESSEESVKHQYRE